ncbi:MAG TPA: magnesium transporter [Lacunisphaera sp.]|nr:magnesium transporter [Lacunisphaera sp.]
MPAEPGNFKNEVAAALDNKDAVRLKALLAQGLARDLAPMLAELPAGRLGQLFRHCPPDLTAAIFSYLEQPAKETILRTLPQAQTAGLLNALPPDDRTAFLHRLPLELSLQILGLLSPEERRISEELLAYPPHSVGRMMTLDFVTVRPEWTVREALDYIRVHGVDRETLSIVYVTDQAGRLLDDVRVRRFLLAEPETRVATLMDGNFATLSPEDDREKALQVFRRYDRNALPVTGPDLELIGIVTADDMLDVAAEEATEDIQKMGGTEALDEPYTTIALGRMVRKRAGWLVVLFLGEMLTATAMSYFEDEIAKAVVLALFVPLIISSGGNAGSQAATLVIRAMALGEVTLARWWLVMRRELAAGFLLGLVLGTIGFLRIVIWSRFSNIYGEHALLVAATVGVALVGIVLWGSLMGSMLPLGLKRLGFDPATSSAPFVATLVDVTGLVIYFSVAYFILRGTLL